MLVPIESKYQIYVDFVARLRLHKRRLQDLKKNSSLNSNDMVLMLIPENENKDPFALRCVLPEIREIPETLLDVPLVSKSAKKNYTLREVAGRPIGRVQYFLNRELKHLMDCEKIGHRIAYILESKNQFQQHAVLKYFPAGTPVVIDVI